MVSETKFLASFAWWLTILTFCALALGWLSFFGLDFVIFEGWKSLRFGFSRFRRWLMPGFTDMRGTGEKELLGGWKAFRCPCTESFCHGFTARGALKRFGGLGACQFDWF